MKSVLFSSLVRSVYQHHQQHSAERSGGLPLPGTRNPVSKTSGFTSRNPVSRTLGFTILNAMSRTRGFTTINPMSRARGFKDSKCCFDETYGLKHEIQLEQLGNL